MFRKAIIHKHICHPYQFVEKKFRTIFFAFLLQIPFELLHGKRNLFISSVESHLQAPPKMLAMPRMDTENRACMHCHRFDRIAWPKFWNKFEVRKNDENALNSRLEKRLDWKLNDYLRKKCFLYLFSAEFDLEILGRLLCGWRAMDITITAIPIIDRK